MPDHPDALHFIELIESRRSSGQRQPWSDLAYAIRTIEDITKADSDSKGVPWTVRVAVAAKIKVGQIAKIQRALKFLEALHEKGAIDDLSRYTSLAIDTVDVAYRYSVVNYDAALEALKKRPNYATILQEYQEVARGQRSHPDARYDGQLRQERYSLACYRHFQTHSSLFHADPNGRVTANDALSGPATGLARHSANIHRLVAPDLLFDCSDGRTGAIRTLAFPHLGLGGQNSYSRLIAKAALESSFFDLYWLIVSEADYAQQLVDDLDDLAIDNTGVVSKASDDDDGISYRQPAGPPSPDRRNQLMGAATASASRPTTKPRRRFGRAIQASPSSRLGQE